MDKKHGAPRDTAPAGSVTPSDLTAPMPQLGPLFELASLAPKVAIDAALALLQSADPLARRAAAQLGARVASAQGSKASRSDALATFMVKMLASDWAVAVEFMTMAEPAARKLAGKICELLTPERALALERSYPGFVKNLGPATICRMPEVAGQLRAEGLIDAVKLFEIHCAAASDHFCSASQLPHLSQLLAEKLCDSSKGEPWLPASVKELEALLARSQAFPARVEAVFPRWSREFWETFWSLSFKSAAAREKAAAGAFCATLATSVDGFSSAPPFSPLNAAARHRFESLVQAARDTPTVDAFAKIGARMARASESEVLEFANLDCGPHSLEWKLGPSNDSLLWNPANSTARVLRWLPGDARSYEPSLAAVSARAAAWMALAEALRAGGAPPPIFERAPPPGLARPGALRAGRDPWPPGLRASLAPAMFLSKFGHAPNSPVFEWLASASEPDEIPAIRSWLSAVGGATPETRAYEAFLDAVDLLAHTPKARPAKIPGARL